MKATEGKSNWSPGISERQAFHADMSTAKSAWLVMPLLCLGILLSVISGRDAEMGAQIVPTVFLTIIAFIMAMSNSRWLIIYVISVYIFAPEIRRLVDWEYHHYHSITPLSLVPLLCNSALLIPILRQPMGLSRSLKTAIGLFSAALLYAGILGLARNGATAIYEMATLLLPMLAIPYMALRPFDIRERNQWLASLTTIGVIVAFYGWVQFITAPDWDMFWLVKSGMTSSMGDPGPMNFRVFSTINSTGPAAWFLSFTIAIALVNRQWRGPFGWFGILLMVSALAITEVRSGWVAVLVAVVLYLGLSSGTSRWRLVGVVVLLALGVSAAIPYLPGGEKTIKRVQSLGNLKEDNSANTRLSLTADLIPVLLKNPLGKGTGSTGVGAKLDNPDDNSAGNGSIDNGIFALILTFGFLGSIAFFYAIWLLARHCFVRMKSGVFQDHARLGQSVCITALVLLCFNNPLVGIGGIVIWFLMGSAFGRVAAKETR